jgi:hypothetical protein
MQSSDVLASAKSPVAVRDLQTRFLYPFTFRAGALPAIARELRRMTYRDGAGQHKDLWDRSSLNRLYTRPHHFYEDELLPEVIDYLFSDGRRPVEEGREPRDDELKHCGYFRVVESAASAWFHGADLVKVKGKKGAETFEPVCPVRAAEKSGIEVFLFPGGVGVLSIALRANQAGLDAAQAADFNYLIAQYRRKSHVRFRRRHRADPGSTSPATSQPLPSPPALDRPFEERLGVEGGSFEINELIELLLGPLADHGAALVDGASCWELLVYTVVRLGPDADFGDPVVQEWLGPFLAGLAQVEESGHSGAPPGVPAMSNELLNRRHWVSIGLLGAVHLISDQPPENDEVGSPSFNEMKAEIIRGKYFIPFLIALMQRVALGPLVAEARGVLVGPTGAAWERSERLRQELAAFAVEGYFPQVSVRHALHRWYKVAREGLDIPAAWEEVRRSIADVNAAITALRLEENQQIANKTLQANVGISTELVKAQEVVHTVEIFLVSVYAAHLTHMFAWENDPWRGLYVATMAALGAMIAAYFVAQRRVRRTWAAFGVVLFGIATLLWATTTPLPHPLEQRHAEYEVPHVHRPLRRDLYAWVPASILVVASAVFVSSKGHRAERKANGEASEF